MQCAIILYDVTNYIFYGHNINLIVSHPSSCNDMECCILQNFLSSSSHDFPRHDNDDNDDSSDAAASDDDDEDDEDRRFRIPPTMTTVIVQMRTAANNPIKNQ